MKKFIFIYSLLLPNFIFAQSIPSNLSTIDTEYLESLPESVRADIEAEIEKNKTDETNTLKRRPSSELYKYETVMEWEQFQRQRNEELNKSERFGLNLFRSMQSSFMPINEPNFGNNYILDYGDIVEINLYGNTALSYELEVKRDGTISIPELGSTSVGGLNYQQGVDKIVNKIESSYTGTQVDVNLKEIRDIKILITGNVEYPGIYTLSGNSNVLQALNIAGGVNEIGTLREIEIKRNGETVSVVDLYDALIFGDLSEINQLQSGDAIYVKPLKKLVRAGSGFFNEALFELKDTESLIDLFKFSGGVNKNIANAEFTLVRADGTIQNDIDIDDRNLSKIDVMHLDSLYFITSNIGTIRIFGEVARPGAYSIMPGDDIYDILERAGGYTNEAYPFGGVLKRKKVEDLEQDYMEKSYRNLISFLVQNPDKLEANTGIGMILEEFKSLKASGRVVSEFDFQELKENPSKRTTLSDMDEIHIPHRSNVVYVYGDVGNPKALSFNDMYPANEYISLAGGLNRSADKSHILVISPNGESSVLNYSKFANILREDIDIYPGSMIYVPQKIGSVQGVEFYSVIAPIFSSLALSLASLNSISD